MQINDSAALIFGLWATQNVNVGLGDIASPTDTALTAGRRLTGCKAIEAGWSAYPSIREI